MGQMKMWGFEILLYVVPLFVLAAISITIFTTINSINEKDYYMFEDGTVDKYEEQSDNYYNCDSGVEYNNMINVKKLNEDDFE